MDEKELYTCHQAIECGMRKVGFDWDTNRQRLSFYEAFDEYIKCFGNHTQDQKESGEVVWPENKKLSTVFNSALYTWEDGFNSAITECKRLNPHLKERK